MKFTRLTLRSPVTIDGMSVSTINASKDFPIVFDAKLDSFRYGLHGIPSANVVRWECAPTPVICQDCKHQFENAQALGSHAVRVHKGKGAAKT